MDMYFKHRTLQNMQKSAIINPHGSQSYIGEIIIVEIRMFRRAMS
jgi:hypothetical protein